MHTKAAEKDAIGCAQAFPYLQREQHLLQVISQLCDRPPGSRGWRDYPMTQAAQHTQHIAEHGTMRDVLCLVKPA